MNTIITKGDAKEFLNANGYFNINKDDIKYHIFIESGVAEYFRYQNGNVNQQSIKLEGQDAIDFIYKLRNEINEEFSDF